LFQGELRQRIIRRLPETCDIGAIARAFGATPGSRRHLMAGLDGPDPIDM